MVMDLQSELIQWKKPRQISLKSQLSFVKNVAEFCEKCSWVLEKNQLHFEEMQASNKFHDYEMEGP